LHVFEDEPFENGKIIPPDSLKCNVRLFMSPRRKLSSKEKLSIAEMSNSSELRLTEKGAKGISFMQKSAGVTKNSKSQISNIKQITMTKIQNLFRLGFHIL
jgi:hypothetical protein